jgi:hypothetical protein
MPKSCPAGSDVADALHPVHTLAKPRIAKADRAVSCRTADVSIFSPFSSRLIGARTARGSEQQRRSGVPSRVSCRLRSALWQSSVRSSISCQNFSSFPSALQATSTRFRVTAPWLTDGYFYPLGTISSQPFQAAPCASPCDKTHGYSTRFGLLPAFDSLYTFPNQYITYFSTNHFLCRTFESEPFATE